MSSLDDDYRWCIYCGADCIVPDRARHHARCPSVTGMYPVDEDDLAMHMCCDDCRTPFQPGDSYLLRDAGDAAEPISVIICLGCGCLLSQGGH